jgi:secreted trypsin-like serine protease
MDLDGAQRARRYHREYHMRRIWVPTLGMLAALGACAPPSDEEAQTITQPIVNGTSDKGDPSMVEFLAIKGNLVAKCTATLISPHVLLTAAHCVYETKGSTYAVFPGADDAAITSADLLHVQAATYDPQYNSDPSMGHDLAIVALVNPLSAPIIPLNRAAITDDDVGKTVRYIGYGLNDGVKMTGDGVKRQGSAPLGGYNQDLLLVRANPHNTCEGDSGGPLLVSFGGKGEAIAGITSFGTDKTCLKDSYFQRVDTQTDWIDQMIAKYDGTTPPGSGASPDARPADARPADAGAPEETPDAGPSAPMSAGRIAARARPARTPT